jgi:hypothetical protein
MDTKEFLQLVVPEGNICIAEHAEIEGKKLFIHYACDSHEKAASLAKFLDSKGKTIFYALASFKETFKNPKGKPRIKRTQKNVKELKSIWLDIDYKDCPKKELVPKLAQFLKETGIPKPTMMVNSGGGLHIYWCLSSPISAEQWVPLAEGLKTLCKKHDLPADHVCTTDQARVLRPIGTHNRKYDPPQLVKTGALSGKTYDYDSLLAHMPKVDISALPAHLRGVTANTKEFTGGNERKVDTKKVLQGCAVLRHVLKTQGAEQSEPEWNATLLLLKFLDGGEKLVHPMSKGHIDYTPAGAEEKWQQKLDAETTGPTTCATLAQYGHEDRCKGCPIYKSQSKKTPLAMGYADPTPQQPQKTKAPKAVRIGAPNHSLPPNWRVAHGGGMERKEKSTEEEGGFTWKLRLKRTWTLKESQRMLGSRESTSTMECLNGDGSVISLDVPSALLAGNTVALWEHLGRYGAVLQFEEKKWWVELMATWLSKLQDESAVVDAADRLGWVKHDDKLVGFAAGTTMYPVKGKPVDSVRTQQQHQNFSSMYKPVGKLSKWREVANFVCEQDNPVFTSVLASAFAAPLVQFVGIPGTVMSIVSNRTGMGKTSALHLAQSVWGNPQKGLNSTVDTKNAVMAKLGYLNNLPSYWDEVRDQALENFKGVVFDTTQGKGKARLSQNANAKEIDDWNTMMTATSNLSLFEFMMSCEKSDASGARVFEITMDNMVHQPDLNKTRLFAQLDTNYGVAGQVYAAHLAKNQKKIKKRVEKMVLQTYEWAKGINESEVALFRFWCATIAVLIVGANEANRCGLTNINIGTLASFLRDTMSSLHERATGAKVAHSAEELFGNYVQQHQQSIIEIKRFPEPREQDYVPEIIGNINLPTGKSLIMVKAGETYRFRISDFKKWLRKSQETQWSAIHSEFEVHLDYRELNTHLGLGLGKYQLPRSRVGEVTMPTYKHGDGDD